MLSSVKVHRRSEVELLHFLQDHDYEVETITSTVVKITRAGEPPVFLHTRDQALFFEMDLGSLEGLGGAELFMELLSLNTEILPVSVGIDATAVDDPRLVLVESREAHNLDANELMCVLDSLELASDRVANILKKHI